MQTSRQACFRAHRGYADRTRVIPLGAFPIARGFVQSGLCEVALDRPSQQPAQCRATPHNPHDSLVKQLKQPNLETDKRHRPHCLTRRVRLSPFSVFPKGKWSAGRRQGFARPLPDPCDRVRPHAIGTGLRGLPARRAPRRTAGFRGLPRGAAPPGAPSAALGDWLITPGPRAAPRVILRASLVDALGERGEPVIGLVLYCCQ